MRLISINQLREGDIFKIGLLYTEQEKCSYKPILKEKIHVLMQAFALDTESHQFEIKYWQVRHDSWAHQSVKRDLSTIILLEQQKFSFFSF